MIVGAGEADVGRVSLHDDFGELALHHVRGAIGRGQDRDLEFAGETVPAAEIMRMRAALAAVKPDAARKAREFYGVQARNLAKISTAGIKIILDLTAALERLQSDVRLLSRKRASGPGKEKAGASTIRPQRKSIKSNPRRK